MSIFDKFKKADLAEWLDWAGHYVCSFDVQRAYDIALETIAMYRGGLPTDRALALQDQWYESLDNGGQPDYSVYSDPYYISDMWACWVVYSRGYLRSLMNNRGYRPGGSVADAFGSVRSVADLGCGIGFTTATLKQMFPQTLVWGTNLADTDQFVLAQRLGVQHGFTVTESITLRSDVGADLVFASEYFEHFEYPIEHLEQVLEHLDPEALVIANAFGSRSVGHFDFYKHGNDVVKNTAIGRRFNNTLREAGYTQLDTRFWNNRPACWVREHKVGGTA